MFEEKGYIGVIHKVVREGEGNETWSLAPQRRRTHHEAIATGSEERLLAFENRIRLWAFDEFECGCNGWLGACRRIRKEMLGLDGEIVGTQARLE